MMKIFQTSGTIQPPPSTARQRYTPLAARTAATSSAAAQSIPLTTTSNQSNNSTGNPIQTQSGGSIPPPKNPSLVSSWVVFGIKDRSDFNDIENIAMPMLHMNDVVFFRELKRLENKYRWPILRWFSPYIFTYCKFVQVCITSTYLTPIRD